MEVELYYRKYKPGKFNYDMDQFEASRLTLEDLLHGYALVAEITQPEGTTADRIFAMYQDRPVKLPLGVNHESMSVGDIVLLDKTICVCCKRGWYKVELKSIPSRLVQILGS
ncbi:MAG: hypothetical protein V1767_01115 [Chloroflexota bacterium]